MFPDAQNRKLNNGGARAAKLPKGRERASRSAMPVRPAEPVFFASPAEFRTWLEKHHQLETELWVGYRRKATGRPSMTWPESVDEALCFGWIDGIRKSVDETSYMIRFTPRKPTSNWSLVNMARIEELTREQRMWPAGLKVFEERAEARTGIYAYEQRKNAVLDAASEKEFRKHAKAWKFYEAQSPSYRRLSAWRVISAKQDVTRRKRLAQLIEASEAARRLL
jgi:uncharacterized protein YdeI (YjbR/CyaY-like superfamily)